MPDDLKKDIEGILDRLIQYIIDRVELDVYRKGYENGWNDCDFRNKIKKVNN